MFCFAAFSHDRRSKFAPLFSACAATVQQRSDDSASGVRNTHEPRIGPFLVSPLSLHLPKAQIKVTGTSGGKALKSENLTLFRFVTERVKPTSTKGQARMRNGKSLVSEWNNAHTEWAYETSVGDLDARRFWRNYNGIKRTMAVGPLYQTHHAVGDRPVRETEELDSSG
jgi:hypothetical protein